MYSINQYILYLQSLSFVQVQTRLPSPKKVYVFNQPVHALPAVTQLRTGADKTSVTQESVRIQSTSTYSTCSHSASYRCRQDLRHPRKCMYSINQYMLYLQSLSFVQVQTRPPSPRKCTYSINQYMLYRSHSASYRCRQDLRHPRKCTYSSWFVTVLPLSCRAPRNDES